MRCPHRYSDAGKVDGSKNRHKGDYFIIIDKERLDRVDELLLNVKKIRNKEKPLELLGFKNSKGSRKGSKLAKSSKSSKKGSKLAKSSTTSKSSKKGSKLSKSSKSSKKKTKRATLKKSYVDI